MGLPSNCGTRSLKGSLAKGRDFFVTSIEVRNKQTITLPTTTGSTWTELAIRCCVVLCCVVAFRHRPGVHIAASLLADQQNKSSGSYQHRNQNTDDERNNPMPTVDFFRSSAFLRCSEP